MKYTCSIEINLPIDKTAELWNNEAYFSKWQDGFQSIELLSGEKDTPDAKSRILFSGKQKIELIETILICDLPTEKKAVYQHKYTTNTQHTNFKKITPNQTRFTSNVEYTKTSGLMIKLMAKFFPSIFRKQSEKWMNQFKDFAENHRK